MSTPTLPRLEEITQAQNTAALFDQNRHCWWNFSNRMCRYDNAPDYCAADIPAFSSLGNQCHATLHELSLIHTLRPCKNCGSDHLYVHSYGVSCCSCFGDPDLCENRKETLREGKDPETECCCSYAENANLPDAITLWNLHHADNGPTGRVIVCGGG